MGDQAAAWCTGRHLWSRLRGDSADQELMATRMGESVSRLRENLPSMGEMATSYHTSPKSKPMLNLVATDSPQSRIFLLFGRPGRTLASTTQVSNQSKSAEAMNRSENFTEHRVFRQGMRSAVIAGGVCAAAATFGPAGAAAAAGTVALYEGARAQRLQYRVSATGGSGPKRGSKRDKFSSDSYIQAVAASRRQCELVTEGPAESITLNTGELAAVTEAANRRAGLSVKVDLWQRVAELGELTCKLGRPIRIAIPEFSQLSYAAVRALIHEHQLDIEIDQTCRTSRELFGLGAAFEQCDFFVAADLTVVMSGEQHRTERLLQTSVEDHSLIGTLSAANRARMRFARRLPRGIRVLALANATGNGVVMSDPELRSHAKVVLCESSDELCDEFVRGGRKDAVVAWHSGIDPTLLQRKFIDRRGGPFQVALFRTDHSSVSNELSTALQYLIADKLEKFGYSNAQAEHYLEGLGHFNRFHRSLCLDGLFK